MIKFFNDPVLGDYVYANNGEKIFISDIKAVQIVRHCLAIINEDIFADPLLRRKNHIDFHGDYSIVAKQIEDVIPDMVRRFDSDGEIHLMHISMFDKLSVYSYDTVSGRNGVEILMRAKPITMDKDVYGANPFFTSLYIRMEDFPRVAMQILLKAGAGARSALERYLKEIERAAEVYKFFSGSEEKDGINLFLEMKKGGLL